MKEFWEGFMWMTGGVTALAVITFVIVVIVGGLTHTTYTWKGGKE